MAYLIPPPPPENLYCLVCSQLVTSPVALANGAAVSRLWSYVYHKNVRETIEASGYEAPENDEKEGAKQTKLTFSLSVGGNKCKKIESSTYIPEDESSVLKICEDCSRELEKLEKLHQELESIKAKIEAQLEKINEFGLKEGTVNRGIDEKAILERICPKLQMSLAGAVTGKENVAQALHFLCSLSDGMSLMSSWAPSSQSNQISSLEPASLVCPEHQEDFQADCSSFNGLADDMVANVKTENAEHKFGSQTYDQEEESSNCLIDEDGTFTITGSTAYSNTEDCSEDDEDMCSQQQSDPLSTEAIIKVESEVDIEQLQRLSSKQNFRSPGSNNSNKILIPCEVCGKQISNSKQLKIHMRSHTGEKPYQCDICNRQFSQHGNLLTHKRTHSNYKPHSCDICLKRFTDKSTLNKHKKSVHNPLKVLKVKRHMQPKQ